MSDRTKLILAITLGSVGLALGALGTIVAFNAKNDVKSNQEVTTVVEQRFAEAQKRQDKLEAKQISGAEKLVRNLSRAEKNQLGKINSNAQSISALRRRVNDQQQQIDSLRSSNRKQATQISNLQKQVQQNFNSLNDRIDRTNQRISNSGGG
jgi:chromosome segregation ATPase